MMTRVLSNGLRASIAAMALTSLCGWALAQPGKGDFFDGLRAYDARDIDGAIEGWTNAARAGDLRSQKQLGDLYVEGRRVPQNFATAYYWYALAAANPIDGTGDASRTASGALLPALAAVKGQAATEAQKLRDALTLGDQLAAHTAVEDMYASRGATGVFQLAEAYKDGKGLPANKIDAFRFYVVASFMGSEDAVKARDALVTTLQPVQVASGQRAAAEWLKARGIKAALPPPGKKLAAIPAPPPPEPKAPLIAPPPAQPDIAKPATPPKVEAPKIVEAPPPGREAPVSPEMALDRAPKDAPQASFLTPRQASIVELEDARTDTQIVQRALKVLRIYGGRINGDFNRETRQAIRDYQRSGGNRGTGQLTARQLERLLNRAAQDKDDSITQYHYGRMLIAGRYVQRNTQRALELLDRSAEQGIAESAFFLGVIYRDGVGVAKDQTVAANRFREAEKLGHPKAGEALKLLRTS